MKERAGCLVFVAMVALGTLTAAPVLFNFLGLALYAALLHECGKHVIPGWPPKWMRRTANPAPPPVPEVVEKEEPQVIELGTGAGMLIYPDGRKSEKT